MYTKNSKIITDKQNLSNYIDGYDVYDSLILTKLIDPALERTSYEILTYEYRPDLIAKDFYGDTSYAGLILITCGIGLEKYTRGTVLSLISKTDLDTLLGGL